MQVSEDMITALSDEVENSGFFHDGVDEALTLLCKFLGVDPGSVRWDAATETVDGDIFAVIGNILRAKFGEDWGPDRGVPEKTEALRLLAAEDERQSKLHEILETIREQIRLEVAPEHRPDGLFKSIQDAVYAMRGRTRLMDDAAITQALKIDGADVDHR